ncbi:MAG: HlyD family secretion protein [Planctomycetota bacterium]|jgi:HlyD family secretion protein
MRLPITAVLLSLCLVVGCSEKEEDFEYQVHEVTRSDLRITIRQKGTIEARDPFAVQNPIEGKSEILELIPEGTYVEEGDFLFALDVSSQKDQALQQSISTSNAEQALFNDRQQLEITKQQNESNIKNAELNVLFAELDMRQYLEGDLPSEQEAIESEITLSAEEEERSKETLSWSVKLAEKGYISKDKLDADRLLVKRRQIEKKLANRRQEVLTKYTSKKRVRELESQLEESKRELLRVKARSSASQRQKESDVKARLAQYELEKKKQERIEHSLTNNRVMSPRGGIVIYAREGGRRERKPMEAGSQVRKGQTILELPNMDRVLVDVDVHESSIHMVKLGLPVIITTDTGESIVGNIESVATVADSQSWYRNPDLKVYSTKVTINNPGRKLKPGMNCYAEVVIDEIKDAISIPTQAVYDNGQKTYCYVKVDGLPALREIKVGLNNTEAIHVIEGVSEGEEVFLAVPDDAPSIPLATMKTQKVDVSAAKAKAAKAAKAAAAKPAGNASVRSKDGKTSGRSRRGGSAGKKPSAADMEKWKNMSAEDRAAAVKKMRAARSGDSE